MSNSKTNAPDDMTLVRAALEAGEAITALQAYRRWGVLHLASAVRRLREKYGLPINSRMIELPNGKRVALYSLARQGQAG